MADVDASCPEDLAFSTYRGLGFRVYDQLQHQPKTTFINPEL